MDTSRMDPAEAEALLRVDDDAKAVANESDKPLVSHPKFFACVFGGKGQPGRVSPVKRNEHTRALLELGLKAGDVLATSATVQEKKLLVYLVKGSTVNLLKPFVRNELWTSVRVRG